jgi:hypothetical protein
MGLGLDLAGADLTGSDFEAIPSGWYHCSVADIRPVTVKNDGGKLPKGTPGINVHLKVAEGEYKNRMVFRNLYMAPAKVGNKPYEHKATMDRILGQFFVCIGFTSDQVTSAGFDPDVEDLKGRELLVSVGQKPKYNAPDGVMDNEVKGFRPLSSDSGSGGSLI